MSRIHSEWLGTGSIEDPFVPPFMVYANRGLDDDERLKKIIAETGFGPARTVRTYDFLQADERRGETAYDVRVNSFGFRGPETTKKKPAGTYRIAVVGSYEAFGHGVADDETYEAQLQRILNERVRARRVEVLNFGREADTAIGGLAKLRHVVFDFDPDLIIIDYGHVDGLIFDDNVLPTSLRFPDTPGYLIVRKAMWQVIGLLDKSLLWNTFMRRYSFVMGDEKAAQFKDAMQKMLDVAAAHEVPVVLVRQMNSSMNSRILADIAGDKTPLVDVLRLFEKDPPAYPKPESWKSAPWSKTWLGELDPALVSGDGLFGFYPYKLNLLQLNADGQRILAAALADVIESRFLRR